MVYKKLFESITEKIFAFDKDISNNELLHRCNKEKSVDCKVFFYKMIVKEPTELNKREDMCLQGFAYYATLLLVREIGGKLYKKTP